MNEGETLLGLIQRRLGYVPGYLAIAASAPQVLENIWRQSQLAFLDNPLPALFKEKLLAFLARYCPHRYWLIWHSCRLRELGITSAQVVHLLKRPTPMPSELTDHIESVQSLTAWPQSSSPAEWAIFWLAVEAFLQRDEFGACCEAISRAVGQVDYQQLVALLAYARTMHLWVQAHPKTSAEADAPVIKHLPAFHQEEPSIVELFDEHARCSDRLGQDHSELLVYAINQRDQAARLLGKCDGCPGTALLHAPFPVMIYAEDGQVMQINDVWTELSGYGLSDISTMSAWCQKAQPGTEPHSPEDIDALFESDQRVEEGHTAIITRQGGHLIWDFASVPLGRLPDGRRAVMRVATDVTERCQLEHSLLRTNEMLQAVMHASPLAIVVIDLDANVTLWNPAAERLFGWHAEEVLGNPLPIIPRERQNHFREARRMLLQGRSNGPAQVPCLRKNGSQIMANLATAVVRDRNGQVLSLLGILSESNGHSTSPKPSRA